MAILQPLVARPNPKTGRAHRRIFYQGDENINVSRRIYINGESIDSAIIRLAVAHREQLRMNVLLHSYHESAFLRRFKGGRALQI